MKEDVHEQVVAAIEVLADLTPSARVRTRSLMVPTDWFRWLPLGGVTLFKPGFESPYPPYGATSNLDRFGGVSQPVGIERQYAARLAAIERLRPAHRPVRAGWLWVAGQHRLSEGRTQKVLHPLLTVPIKVEVGPPGFGATVLAAGDVEVSELVLDRPARLELEAIYEVGGGALDSIDSVEPPLGLLVRLSRLHDFARAAAAAAGFEPDLPLVAVNGSPEEHAERPSLAIVAGVALYVTNEVGPVGAGAMLREWAARDDLETTAFAGLYEPQDDAPPLEAVNPESPYPLTPRQRAAVVSASGNRVTVVSGAAGTGKSQTVVATALATIADGGRVLAAARTDAAVDALMDLFEKAPGPQPILFGSDDRRKELAERLASGTLRPADRDDVEAARRRHDAAAADYERLRSEIVAALDGESALADRHGVREEAARRDAPGLFAPECDLAEARRLCTLANDDGSWMRRRRARRALDELTALADAEMGIDLGVLDRAIGVARSARLSGDVIERGGTALDDDWAELTAIDERRRAALGKWLEVEARRSDRLSHGALEEVSVLATALRSGRAARRAQLEHLSRRVTGALPLWVGTLADVEDLLPATPGLFDLVILDESTSIEQPLAAPALLRAHRACIVGDPRQLRHVSFLDDERRDEVVSEHGLDEDPILAGRLDVRRNSMFDVAAGAAPITALDEHFRSDPHLIDFVARRLYAGELRIATRNPANESRDCIDVVRVTATPDVKGIVVQEVDAVIDMLRAWLRAGHSSVGVVSPFRAQADAIEAAVLAALTHDEIDALDLRIGTAHGFQGNERDRMIVSVGIAEGGANARWRYVDDPHLFAVLATRARDHMTWLVSAAPPGDSLLADYFKAADSPPGRPASVGHPTEWQERVASHLADAGLPVIVGYPVGRHVVDVCVGDAASYLAVECAVHPDGPDAHIDRRLDLHRCGWRTIDAYPSKWADRIGELVVRVKASLRPW